MKTAEQMRLSKLVDRVTKEKREAMYEEVRSQLSSLIMIRLLMLNGDDHDATFPIENFVLHVGREMVSEDLCFDDCFFEILTPDGQLIQKVLIPYRFTKNNNKKVIDEHGRSLSIHQMEQQKMFLEVIAEYLSQVKYLENRPQNIRNIEAME
jgi:hypothetical protein